MKEQEQEQEQMEEESPFCSKEECFYSEPYIEGGYRKRLSVVNCLRSLFYLHNESGNVWTQIVGFFIFSYLAFSSFIEFVPSYQESPLQFMIFLAYFYTLNQCFVTSAVAHLFCCMSPVIRARLFQLDYTCIFLCGIGTHLITAYYSICFHKYWVYSTSLLVFFSVITCCWLVYHRELQLQEELKKSDVCGGTGALLRSVLYFITMNLVYLPLYYDLTYGNVHHGYHFYVGISIPIVYIMGGMLYGFFIPQRFLPGMFDSFSGHSLMHVCMTIGQLCQFYYIKQNYELFLVSLSK